MARGLKLVLLVAAVSAPGCQGWPDFGGMMTWVQGAFKGNVVDPLKEQACKAQDKVAEESLKKEIEAGCKKTPKADICKEAAETSLAKDIEALHGKCIAALEGAKTKDLIGTAKTFFESQKDAVKEAGKTALEAGVEKATSSEEDKEEDKEEEEDEDEEEEKKEGEKKEGEKKEGEKKEGEKKEGEKKEGEKKEGEKKEEKKEGEKKLQKKFQVDMPRGIVGAAAAPQGSFLPIVAVATLAVAALFTYGLRHRIRGTMANGAVSEQMLVLDAENSAE